MTPNLELLHLRDRLEAADPLRPVIELVAEDDSPELRAAVIRRLAAEIRAEREASKEPTSHDGRVL